MIWTFSKIVVATVVAVRMSQKRMPIYLKYKIKNWLKYKKSTGIAFQSVSRNSPTIYNKATITTLKSQINFWHKYFTTWTTII